MNEKIRNFCIIAHIDHGKTTLSDCFLNYSQLYKKPKNKNDALLLDSLAIEKERGVTIKANYTVIKYFSQKKQTVFNLNLIDTPGHADFSYEVLRSLVVCEGVILLVDATKGIQAQTLLNYNLAKKLNLSLIPVINKIDLDSADVEKTANSMVETFDIDPDDIHYISAKYNLDMDNLIEDLIDKIPPPPQILPQNTTNKNKFKAFIYDSHYDNFKGIIIFVKVVQGAIKSGDTCVTLNTGNNFKIIKLGKKTPDYSYCEEITEGDIGFIETGIKQFNNNLVGDTFVNVDSDDKEIFFKYKKLQSVIYSCFYPLDQSKYIFFKKSLAKLQLNDSSLVTTPCFNQALGYGMQCGFLGELHLEITQQRLEEEYNIELITTVPSVIAKILLKNGEYVTINSVSDINKIRRQDIDKYYEPYTKVIIITKVEYYGAIINYCKDVRGEYIMEELISDDMIQLEFEIPLNEIILEFSNTLKTITQGHCSYAYDVIDYRPNKLGILEFMFNKKPVDYFSLIVHADKAYNIASKICLRLQKLIPQQNYDVAIQGSFNNKIIARSTIKALRKNVLSKCYGGDISRKRKLLEKQKKGKKKMKMIGNVAVPKQVFTDFLISAKK